MEPLSALWFLTPEQRAALLGTAEPVEPPSTMERLGALVVELISLLRSIIK